MSSQDDTHMLNESRAASVRTEYVNSSICLNEPLNIKLTLLQSMHITDETAWQHWMGQGRGRETKSDLEKCNTTDLINLKCCNDKNQYNNFWSVSTAGCYSPRSTGMHKMATAHEDKNVRHYQVNFLHSSWSAVTSTKNIILQNITYYRVYKPIFSYVYCPLLETVWPIHWTLVLWMDQSQGWINFFFSNSYRCVRFIKFCWLIRKRICCLSMHTTVLSFWQ